MDLVKEIKRIRSKDEIYINSLLDCITRSKDDNYYINDKYLFGYDNFTECIFLSRYTCRCIIGNLNKEFGDIEDIIIKCIKTKIPSIKVIKRVY